MLETLIRAIREFIPDCQAIYRFGSWGTPAQKHDSDIDLAVLSSSILETVSCWELAQSLASLAGCNVDLVDMLRASTVLRMQVLASADRLYCADDYGVELFEDVVFSSYARLNEERRELVADVRARGSVYGK